MGSENTRTQSRDRLARFGRLVYETEHITRLIRKCRPLIARCANCSSASLESTTSSINIKIFLSYPFFFSSSCWTSNFSTSSSFHVGKKNRSSQYSCIMVWSTGLQEAEPMKAMTKSNFSFIRISRSETALLLPCRRPPIRARLNGILLTRRFGSHEGSISTFIGCNIFWPVTARTAN